MKKGKILNLFIGERRYLMYKTHILSLWKDKKIVGVLSNYYQNEEVTKEAKEPAKTIPKYI